MNEMEMRLELLKLAKGNTSLPTDPEAIIRTARQLEEFVTGWPTEKKSVHPDSEPR